MQRGFAGGKCFPLHARNYRIGLRVAAVFVLHMLGGSVEHQRSIRRPQIESTYSHALFQQRNRLECGGPNEVLRELFGVLRAVDSM